MIKVMLIEDQRLFREGIKALIQRTDDIQVVGMADSGKAAIELIDKKQPDIILMDINSSDVDGIRTTRVIKKTYPDVKVIMLSQHAKEDLVLQGISAGVDGFLLKRLFADSLVRSIRDAYRGETVLSGYVARVIVERIRELTLDKKELLEGSLKNQGYQFTNREIDIAYLLAEGNTNKQIAVKLFLGEGTVKNYISQIYAKLGIHSRKDTVSFFRNITK
ncbi:response regulator transcription factor [Virgibacillus sp. C22-A2]|uniref:Response regulator transcription factor n=1 Tax=Virgibacillus tibetensis TaxID=3042313 RepID=A0ABU6KE13_9BACI|nr:response regulator transcription factor [Virgibacillus sp. C22-A2]